MTWSPKEIESYRVTLFSLHPNGRALIFLKPVGPYGGYYLWFTLESTSPPIIYSSDSATAYFPWDMFDVVLRMLREERPVYVHTDTSVPRLELRTAKESLGEGPTDTSP